MPKFSWQERESDSIVDFGFGKVLLRKHISKKGVIRYLAHIEDNMGKKFASFDFGSELEDREIVEDWASAMIGELDQAGDKQAARERLFETLDYCKALLPPETPPSYYQRMENVKEWLKLRAKGKRISLKLSAKLLYLNEFYCFPMPPYSLNWSQLTNEGGISAESPHGKIIIRPIPESQQIVPRSPYEIVAKFRIYICHSSGATFECWLKQPIDIEAAKKDAIEVLRELDDPTITEEYQLHLEYFFNLLGHLLPDDANLVHHSRLESMATDIINFLI